MNQEIPPAFRTVLHPEKSAVYDTDAEYGHEAYAMGFDTTLDSEGQVSEGLQAYVDLAKLKDTLTVEQYNRRLEGANRHTQAAHERLLRERQTK
jgi:hypothetical protein